MKTILLGVVAALALTSLPVVHAEENTSVKVDAPRPARRYMSPDDFRLFVNKYQLENGQTIVFKQRIMQKYAQLADGDYVRIYAVGANSFVTDSGVRFDFVDEGDTVHISDFQKLPLAKNTAPNGIMMARR
jgi:hypothetical protein